MTTWDPLGGYSLGGTGGGTWDSLGGYSLAGTGGAPNTPQATAGHPFGANADRYGNPIPTSSPNPTGGFAQARNLQAQGADFTGYQNQLNQLLQDPSKIQQTAGYQFQLGQGNEAINRSAAAKGMLNSGNVLAELAKYGQGMASTEYGNQVNRLAGLMQGAQNFGVSSGYYNPRDWYAGWGQQAQSAGMPAPQPAPYAQGYGVA